MHLVDCTQMHSRPPPAGVARFLREHSAVGPRKFHCSAQEQASAKKKSETFNFCAARAYINCRREKVTLLCWGIFGHVGKFVANTEQCHKHRRERNFIRHTRLLGHRGQVRLFLSVLCPLSSLAPSFSLIPLVCAMHCLTREIPTIFVDSPTIHTRYFLSLLLTSRDRARQWTL